MAFVKNILRNIKQYDVFFLRENLFVNRTNSVKFVIQKSKEQPEEETVQ